MKRITLIILAVAAVLAGSVSCDKSDVAPKSSMPLVSMSGIEWKDNGSKWTFNNGATALFLPKAEYASKTYDYCQTYGGDTYFCISNKSNNVEITFYPNTYVPEVVCVRAFHDMP